MADEEPQQMPRSFMVLLCLQIVFLGALYLKMNAIHHNLLFLSQGATEGGGVIEAVVSDVMPGNGPSKGHPHADVEIVAFSDFGCGACRQAQPVLAEMIEKTGESTRLIYRHFPLRPEGPPLDAAVAAQCAHEQGSFWPMYDRLFDQGGDFERATLQILAEELTLDKEAFRSCLDSEASIARVHADKAAGMRWGVTATPTLFLNGRRISGVPSVAVLQRLVAEIRHQDAIPPLGS